MQVKYLFQGPKNCKVNIVAEALKNDISPDGFLIGKDGYSVCTYRTVNLEPC